MRSTDGGRHWSSVGRLSAPHERRSDASDISIDFPSANVGALVVDGVAYRTGNGGRAWRRLPVSCHRYVSLTSVSFPTPATGFAVCESAGASDMAPKVLWETNDSGSTWHVVSRDAQPGGKPANAIGRISATGYNSSLSFFSPQVGFLMADRNGLLRTDSSGRTFRELLFTDDSDDVTGTSWVSPQIGYVSLYFGGLLRTLDGGKHWRVAYRGARGWRKEILHAGG